MEKSDLWNGSRDRVLQRFGVVQQREEEQRSLLGAFSKVRNWVQKILGRRSKDKGEDPPAYTS